jgi:hypothetical protein
VTRAPKSPRHKIVSHPDVIADIKTLSGYGLSVVTAVAAVIDDLAHGRVTGKDLGARRVSGDLTGFCRVKFDVPDHRPLRFRLIYRHLDAGTYEILALGRRDEHAIYRAAVRRLAGPGSNP